MTTADDETNMITITEETSGKFDQLFHSPTHKHTRSTNST